ncbi:SIR2 family protein [Flavipsychrobacter stenotrophus]|nr:SIR2 family protein [Flavipsychrobacter stenotrophus]
MNKIDIIEKIVSGISEFKIIPFFGAGMSKPCGALDWRGLVETLKSELSNCENIDDNLLIAEQYQIQFGRDKLIEKLRDLCALKIRTSDTYQNHLKILAMNPPIIYTTNYDNALEEAADLISKKYLKIVGLNDIVASPHGSNQIIKFHGDFQDDQSIVFTRSDYDERLKIERHPLDVLFRSHILGKSVLFLGYGFGDENIQYIFEKHSEFYGTDNLPPSYIISFSHNKVKEEELKKKNVTTLVLSSPDELTSLITEINSKVFDKGNDFDLTFLNQDIHREVLLNFELDNLKNYISSTNHTGKEKHDKIRRTLEMKILPNDVEPNVAKLFMEFLSADYETEIVDALVLAFEHVSFRNFENIISISFKLIELTENPRYVFSMSNPFSWLLALMKIEMKLCKVLDDAAEISKWYCCIILGYLEGQIAEKKRLEFNQVDSLFIALQTHNYNQLDLEDRGFTKEQIDETIQFYIGQHGQILRNRQQMGSVSNGPNMFRRNLKNIQNQLTNGLPKNVID